MTMVVNEHHPVMLEEALQQSAIKSDGYYIDATFGRGGHASAILNRLDENGHLLTIDKDPQAEKMAEKLVDKDSRVTFHRGSFADIKSIVINQTKLGEVDGILFDLGVSSPQLDDPARGFSFMRDGPLDMRMDPRQKVSAADWIAKAREKEIADVLYAFGDERYSRRIAKAIVSQRQNEEISRTKQLASIIAGAKPKWEKKIHPATRSFQAIRIFINSELEDLEHALIDSVDVLAKNGRLVVISFHSLEDRIVKQFIRKQSRGKVFPKYIPITEEEQDIQLKAVGSMIKPTSEEISHNPRARSACMRVAEKIV